MSVGHIIPIPIEQTSICSFLFNAACLAEKQQLPIL